MKVPFGFLVEPFVVREAEPVLELVQPANEDVFGDRHVQAVRQLLMDEADPGQSGLSRRVVDYRLAKELDGSAVRLKDSAYDVDEGGLPRPVLSDQCDDLPFPDVEVDP